MQTHRGYLYVEQEMHSRTTRGGVQDKRAQRRGITLSLFNNLYEFYGKAVNKEIMVLFPLIEAMIDAVIEEINKKGVWLSFEAWVEQKPLYATGSEVNKKGFYMGYMAGVVPPLEIQEHLSDTLLKLLFHICMDISPREANMHLSLRRFSSNEIKKYPLIWNELVKLDEVSVIDVWGSKTLKGKNTKRWASIVDGSYFVVKPRKGKRDAKGELIEPQIKKDVISVDTSKGWEGGLEHLIKLNVNASNAIIGRRLDRDEDGKIIRDIWDIQIFDFKESGGDTNIQFNVLEGTVQLKREQLSFYKGKISGSSYAKVKFDETSQTPLPPDFEDFKFELE